MSLWAFTVFSYLTLSTTTLAFPTQEACEAARQAASEFSQEERPLPVVGFCKEVRSSARSAPGTSGSASPGAE